MVLVEKYNLLFAMSACISGHKGAAFSLLDLENEAGGLVTFLLKAPDSFSFVPHMVFKDRLTLANEK